jgi:hypothetical protein
MFSTHLSPLEKITETHVNETFNLLGLAPRLCVNSLFYELAEYKSAVNEVIEDIRADQIQKLMKRA